MVDRQADRVTTRALASQIILSYESEMDSAY